MIPRGGSNDRAADLFMFRREIVRKIREKKVTGAIKAELRVCYETGNEIMNHVHEYADIKISKGTMNCPHPIDFQAESNDYMKKTAIKSDCYSIRFQDPSILNQYIGDDWYTGVSSIKYGLPLLHSQYIKLQLGTDIILSFKMPSRILSLKFEVVRAIKQMRQGK
jgi:hypothetical protein